MIFDNCKLYNKISNSVFAQLIECEKVSPYDLFLYYNIVKVYDNELRNYILIHDYCIKIFLTIYEQDYTEGKKHYLPDSLSSDDINTYMEKYINSECPNPNHLETIMYMHPQGKFKVPDEIRYKAKCRYDEIRDEILQNGVSSSYGLRVTLSEDQEERVVIDEKSEDVNISYSTNYLKNTLDNVSILYNLIHLFGFVDIQQMRCAQVFKKSYMSVFEVALLNPSKKIYPISSVFSIYQNFAQMRTVAYYNFLRQNDVFLDEFIEWFFTEYIQNEFNCPQMKIKLADRNSEFSIKCSTIVTMFEAIIKQYMLYLKHGEIDLGLYNMSSNSIKLQDVPSAIQNKYVYGVGREFQLLTRCLFSDQCLLSFVERLYKQEHRYKCFFDLIENEEVYLTDYREEYISLIEKLSSFDLIEVDENKKIIIKNELRVAILRDLYDNDVISQFNCSNKVRDEISYFISKDILETQSTLFSKPEYNYLNYILNHAEYDNSLDLRNKYSHGILQISQDEKEHENNYYTLLRVFILLVLKINDEFILKDKLNQEDGE